MTGKICLVIKDYLTPFPDPLVLIKGEELSCTPKKCEWPGWIWCITGEGKSGWVPENYTEKTSKGCRMLVDYNATELNVKTGEELTILLIESGWAVCTDKDGRKGWVPLENVRQL